MRIRHDSVEEVTTVLPADTDVDLGDAPDPVAATAGEYPTLLASAAAGLLDAWIDWNADGDWGDAGEQVFTSESLAAGANALDFTVPPGATPGPTFARFRLSSAGGLAPTGLTTDGEVEDYPVLVRAPSVLEIPTLGQWALWLLGLLLAGLGAARLRG